MSQTINHGRLVELEDMIARCPDRIARNHLRRAYQRLCEAAAREVMEQARNAAADFRVRARGVSPPESPKSPDSPNPTHFVGLPHLNDNEVYLAQTQGKIYAIKAYRERTNCGLKEAKERVEEHSCYWGYHWNSENKMVRDDL